MNASPRTEQLRADYAAGRKHTKDLFAELESMEAELVIVRANWDAANREALTFRQSVSDMLADPVRLRATIPMSNTTQFLRDFLEWERANPNEPYRDFPGLVCAINEVLRDLGNAQGHAENLGQIAHDLRVANTMLAAEVERLRAENAALAKEGGK